MVSLAFPPLGRVSTELSAPTDAASAHHPLRLAEAKIAADTPRMYGLAINVSDGWILSSVGHAPGITGCNDTWHGRIVSDQEFHAGSVATSVNVTSNADTSSRERTSVHASFDEHVPSAGTSARKTTSPSAALWVPTCANEVAAIPSRPVGPLKWTYRSPFTGCPRLPWVSGDCSVRSSTRTRSQPRPWSSRSIARCSWSGRAVTSSLLLPWIRVASILSNSVCVDIARQFVTTHLHLSALLTPSRASAKTATPQWLWV